MGRTAQWLAVGIALVASVGCTSGSGDRDESRTTVTSSPAPAWLEREVSRQSVGHGGPRHGTGRVVPFASRSAAVAAVSSDRVLNVADPPVYVVVLRGRFTSTRGAFNGATPHGRQLTLLFPQERGDLTVLDVGIGRPSPPPARSKPFTF